MKAIVQDRYGSAEGLRLAEVERPTPAADEVLVRVCATSVHADVWHVVTGLPEVVPPVATPCSATAAQRDRDSLEFDPAVPPGRMMRLPPDDVF